MNARHELAREAERILLDAGCVNATAKHWGPWWTVNGMRADEREVSGHTRDQADPQDPRDLARRLAAQLGPKPEIEEIPEAPETVEETFPLGEGPFDPALAEPPEASETPQDEVPASEDTAPLFAEVDAALSTISDEGGDRDDSGFDTGEVALPVQATAAIDADFTLDTIQLIEPDPNPDFGSDLLEFEGELAGEPERAADASGVAYFGDNIHVIRLAKLGRLSEIADELTPPMTLQDDNRLKELRNFIAGVGEGRWPSNDAFQAELDELEHRVRRESDVQRFHKTRRAELNAADRPAVEAFDPSEGWP